MHMAGCRNLGKVGDAEHLERLADAPHSLSYRIGNATADTGIDLVENQRLARRICGSQGPDGQHDA